MVGRWLKGCCACAWSLTSHRVPRGPLCSLRPVPIRTTRPDRGAVAHLAGLDSLRQLPGDAVRRAAPGGDGPGRTVALALIDRRGWSPWLPWRAMVEL